MICPKCSTELLEDYTFCPQCGSRMPVAGEQTAVESSVPQNSEFEIPAVPAETQESSAVEIPAAYVVHPAGPVIETTAESPAFAAPAAYVSDSMESPIISEPAAPVIFAPTAAYATAEVFTPPSAAVVPAAPATAASAAVSVHPVKTEPVIPKEYKPLTTVGSFFFLLLACIPVIGCVALLIFAFAGKNKSRKSLSRAILIYCLIGILLGCLSFAYMYFFQNAILTSFFDSNSWSATQTFITDTFINY